MRGWHGMRGMALGAALAWLGAGGPALAAEEEPAPAFLLAWQDATRLAGPIGVLTLPPSWTPGGTVVVVVPDTGWPAAARGAAVEAIAATGRGVLELPVPAASAEALATQLAAARRSLVEGFGAGALIALGHGPTGALLPGLPGDWLALARLGPGAPVFELRADAVAASGWLGAGPSLCAAMASGAADDGQPFEAACVTALLRVALR